MPKLPPLLSELALGTYLQFSPHGTSVVARRSRDWRTAVKSARPDWIVHALDRLAGSLASTGLDGWLGRDVTLVPTPGSAPLSKPDALWPALAICRALVERGLGESVHVCLARTEAVPKSALARASDRPSAERHLETIRFDGGFVPSKRVTLVDDVVTLGRTLLAAASHVKAAFPDADVRGFALIHTRREIESIDSPYVGLLRRRGGWIGHEPDW